MEQIGHWQRIRLLKVYLVIESVWRKMDARHLCSRGRGGDQNWDLWHGRLVSLPLAPPGSPVLVSVPLLCHRPLSIQSVSSLGQGVYLDGP